MAHIYFSMFRIFRNLLCFLIIISSSLSLSSQTFDYERAWGTYYGPAGTDLVKLNIDHQNNLHLLGSVLIDNNLTAPYYNQYVTAGGQNVNMSFSFNDIYSNFNNNGNLVTSDYRGVSAANNVFQAEYLVHIDVAGNHYYLKTSNSTFTDTTTANAWFTSDPIVSTGQAHSILYKRDTAGNIVWKTFLPGIGYDSYAFASDENSNLFIYDTTYIQQDITTSGVYNENYQIHYGNNVIQSNAFCAKLGQQGQLLWGTYLPTNVSSRFIHYYGQKLYLIGGGDLDISLNQLSTPNTWQTSPTNESLTALNSQNGTRSWGTYIGAGSTNEVSSVLGIKANETGIYLSGIDTNFSGTNTNYFATSGAYKTQITGVTDYYLTKLNLSGNRIWGTYFGSDGFENITGSCEPIALTQHAVFLVGSTFGTGNNISTPGAYLSNPPSSGGQGNNMYFAQFDLNGNLNWCSYYGGATPMYYNQTINIGASGHSTFYLYGNTQASTGIATLGASQSQLPQNLGQYNTGFIARFNYKGELSTTETSRITSDLVLFDNPNNGNFNIKGKILEKEDTYIKISDASGRLVYQQDLPRNELVDFKLKSSLTAGIYFVRINGNKNNIIKTFKMVVKN